MTIHCTLFCKIPLPRLAPYQGNTYGPKYLPAKHLLFFYPDIEKAVQYAAESSRTTHGSHALWCFHTTDTFRDAILKATNLGDDADTTAAICGQLAGAYYGESGIPAAWLEKLCMRNKITEMADKLKMDSTLSS